MKFIERIIEKQKDNFENKPATIAFLGDSVTQGCFELYVKKDGNLETYFDKNCAYHNYLAKIFAVLYPSVPVNIINAGISGDSAPHAAKRVERDVLSYNPDLVVVCFGLNDVNLGVDGLEQYKEALDNIFTKLEENGTEYIFMTPNMMNTEVSCHLDTELFKGIAENTMKLQNGGVMDMYMDAAREVCKKHNAPVCDCYKKWKTLEKCGADTTELLANKINHPLREMNWLFAYSLAETIFEL